MGLAIGDALGQATKGLKPEAVRQIYKRVRTYQDVRPFIGNGVKSYRMQGLYASQTQIALALMETLTVHKGVDLQGLADLLVRMSVVGPESYFGVFRRPEGAFIKSVMEMPNRLDSGQADWTTAFGSYFPLGVTLALYYGRDSATFKQSCVDVGSMFSSHPHEIAAVALAGFLVVSLGQSRLEPEAVCASAPSFLAEAGDWLRAIEEPVSHPDDLHVPRHFLSDSLRGLSERWESSSSEELERWIVDHANGFLKQPVVHATQAQTANLLPLALVQVLMKADGFEETLARTVEKGRESDKLGGLTGALAGALYGLEQIPMPLQTNLVNNREVKSRGEALLRRRPVKGKDLVEMELGLTRTEAEQKQKHQPKIPKKKNADSQPLSLDQIMEEGGVEWEQDPLVEIRENPRLRRQFERDKSKKKKERRRKPSVSEDF